MVIRNRISKLKTVISAFFVFVLLSTTAKAEPFRDWVGKHQKELAGTSSLGAGSYDRSLLVARQNLYYIPGCSYYWRYKLTNDEAVAILLYTQGGYSYINKTLREGTAVQKQEIQPLLLNLDSALRKLPEEYGVAYRYTNLPTSVLKTYREGMTIKWPSYTSTSGNANWKEKGRTFGNVFLRINTKTAYNVSCYSPKKSEDERLLIRDSRFRILKISADKQTIELEHLD